MRHRKLQGIILKKTNYKEADQIVTAWTKEAGKVRFLAKAVRLSKSKLAFGLSDLSLVELHLAGKHLPVLTGLKPVRHFPTLLSDLKKAAIGFYAAELMLKMTADEHPNQTAFELFWEFLRCLDSLDYSVKYYPLLESFSLKLLTALGFSIEYAQSSFNIPQDLSNHLGELHGMELRESGKMDLPLERIESLHSLINRFVEFILERNLKSELFLSIT